MNASVMNSTRMSNRVASGLSLLLVALWCSWEASDLHAQTSLSIGTVPGYPGTTVQVPVALRQAPGRTVAAQLDVAFNPAVTFSGAVSKAFTLPR